MKVTIEKGLKIIEDVVEKKGLEIVPIEEATQRISAQNLKAIFNLPRFDNSAMDGFAVKLSDAGKKVKVIETVLAGEDKEIILKENSAVKIMTGAKIPRGSEAVVPIEDATIEEDYVTLPKEIKKYANIRKAGEDIRSKDEILKIGEKIDAYKIGMLASQGYSYVKVYKKVKVGVFATGKELKMHYENIEPHQIYNSNTPVFYSRAKELGCEVSFLGSSDDDKESIKKLIKKSQDFDLLITSGGVSVGEADFTKEAFLELGAKIYFDKVEIKPGKPTTFGALNRTFILNLPGNPLAAALNFEIFGKFIINKLSGRNDIYLNYINAFLKEKIVNKPGKDIVIPGFFDGYYFTPSNKRGPGMVSPLVFSNGFIITKKDNPILNKNTPVKFIPISFDFFSEQKKDFYSN